MALYTYSLFLFYLVSSERIIDKNRAEGNRSSTCNTFVVVFMKINYVVKKHTKLKIYYYFYIVYGIKQSYLKFNFYLDLIDQNLRKLTYF